MRISNRSCVRRLGARSMGAARGRNGIAVLAIALTAVLFTALFTIALSINHSFQQANFRQVGGYAHGGFKYLTQEQAEVLREDPLIREYGIRRFVGMPVGAPFEKAHVEVGYSDANQAKWMFIDPVEGALPAEGTNQAATDTRVLFLLGVEPALGAEFTLTVNVDGTETTETFALCGWWEYDGAITASHVLLPHSRAREIFQRLDTRGDDGMTGRWNMDVLFKGAVGIEKNVETVLENNGYQAERADLDGYIATGVNWGYTGARAGGEMDPVTAVGAVLLLALIGCTGYLIIYNVFQISVTNDIRFYGLLKTIGTTGRQIRGLIRHQALLLSVAGIPLGLLAGYALGVRLTPFILLQLNGVVVDAVSASPLIFLLAAVFSLVTVLISCRRPGKLAARVSPVEAVRYTEGAGGRRTLRRADSGASLPKMALANLGRSPRKTAVTLISLSLAVVLLNLTVTFVGGFDMDKYLRNMAADFLVADAGYFQVDGAHWNGEMGVPRELIAEIEGRTGAVTGGGRTYGQTTAVQQFVSEAYFRAVWGQWNPAEAVDAMVAEGDRLADGRLADNAQLFGMEPFVLDRLDLLDGDLAPLYEPGGNAIAAVYSKDDYGVFEPESHWAKVGDRITLRYVEEFEYYDTETGEILPDIPEDGQNWSMRAKTYREMEYEVVALVGVPLSLSYRFFGSDEFVLNDQTFIRDTGTDTVLYYACDTDEAETDAMERYLGELTGGGEGARFDYESRETYRQEFAAFRNLFLLLGGVLSAIIGLVGVLNFLNAVLTGILTRRREFAVLQAVGMTGRQLKAMLIWEGLFYALGAILLALAVSAATGPLVGGAFERIFWFFTYRFTVLPSLAALPLFALLGVCLPLGSYRAVARRSVVERLREE